MSENPASCRAAQMLPKVPQRGQMAQMRTKPMEFGSNETKNTKKKKKMNKKNGKIDQN
jgi:hypothetical protein